MTNRYEPAGSYRTYDETPAFGPGLFDAVLSRRVIAFVFDAILVGLLTIPFAVVVFVFGLVTFGLGWFLMAPVFVLLALAYVGLTLGGPASATIGMRLVGIEVRTWNGRPLYPLLAVAHAVLFWLSVSLLTPFILLVGLLTERRQLLHDMVLGVVVVNTSALRD